MTKHSSFGALKYAVVLLLLANSVSSQAIVGNVGLYNLGATTDLVDFTNGLVWKPFTTTGTAKNDCAIFKANTPPFDNPDLFCQYSEWSSSTTGVISVPVPSAGIYTLILYLSEIGEVPGSRIVDIYIQGTKTYANLDVAERMGVSYGVFTLSINRVFTDGAFSLEIKAVKGNPTLAAIQVVPAEDSPVTAPVPSPTMAPVPQPVAAPVTAPVDSTISAPVAPPVIAPVPQPVAAPETQPVAAPVTEPVTTPPSIYYNLGATAPYTDQVAMTTWSPDPFTSTGSAKNVCTTLSQFQNFANVNLYCQYREWSGNTSGVLEIPVPSIGIYNATLYFVNAGDSPGQNIVDVYVEGQLVYANLDGAALIGNSYGSFRARIPRTITDGAFSIEIKAVAGEPSLAAIEVVPVLVAPISTPVAPPVMGPVPQPVPTPAMAPAPQPVAAPETQPVAAPVMAPAPQPVADPVNTPSSIYYNLGATAPYTDQVSMAIWSPDPFTSTGSAKNACTTLSQIQNFANVNLYCQYREWSGNTSGVLNVPVQAAGLYNATLYFVNVGESPGQHIVDVYAEGQLVYDDLDIAALLDNSYGSFRARIPRMITDGTFSIEIKSVAGRPWLAAIQVTPMEVVASETTTNFAAVSSQMEIDATSFEMSSSPLLGRPSTLVVLTTTMITSVLLLSSFF